MQPERLLDRFLRYVRVNTTAGDGSTYPSSPGQLELGRQLVDEMTTMGLADVHQDSHGLVWGTLPANVDGVATIAFNAHLDTSPETTGANVQPQVVRNYQSRDLVLPGDRSKVIRVEENPELNELVGCTLVTTDGTTLLGADDKAGIAVILEATHWLLENPDVPHGEVRVLFTCDEEIGHGVDHVDLDKVNAVVAYTLDGGGANTIDIETFSGDGATVVFRGINIHPSIAKERMVNAVRAAGAFVSRLPRARLAPESTCEREGFIHPYVIGGGVGEVSVKVLLRDFDTANLKNHADLVRQLAHQSELEFPGVEVHVDVQAQYRNLGDGLKREPRAAQYAIEAHHRLQRVPEMTIVRGGTDGSMFTEKGLPTPNLSTGQHNIHSPLEWACLDEMIQAAELVAEIIQVWADKELAHHSD